MATSTRTGDSGRTRSNVPQRLESCALAAGLMMTPVGVGAQIRVAPQPGRYAQVSAELAQDLLGWAQRLSGRQPVTGQTPPRLEPLDDEMLARTVCPDHPGACRGLVAAYDTDRRRIIYRASLDMRDPTDQSFIVHELLHWLQHVERGKALEASCESMLDAEREAYAVQNQYLSRFKQWQRVGDVLRFTFCSSHADSAEPTVRFDASTGPITTTRVAPPPPGR